MSTNKSATTEAPQPESAAANFRADFMASLVVFLVALPLCIGIAVAVGVNPARGLITGIIGGLIVGWFAGSPLQVSGPAAGLFVIIADLLSKSREKFATLEEIDAQPFASPEVYALAILGLAVFLAGVIQIVAGQVRLGQWFRAVSPAVIKGMLSGIGVLIFLSQFHVMLDHKAMYHGKKAHGALQYMATIPEAILKCFSSDTSKALDRDNEGAKKEEPQQKATGETKAGEAAAPGKAGKKDADKVRNHHLAALTGIIALACFVIWPKIVPAKLKFLPAALVGIIVPTIVATITKLEVQLLEVPDNMLSEVSLPTAAWLGLITDPAVLTGAIVIALVASAETLLCATAVDQMHQGPRTKYDQELSAQGVGNIMCGIVGALPMTGVIVRSSANVASGAKTRYATIMHGLWLLLFVSAIPFVLNYIPRSALGALLVFTGYKLVNVKDIKTLWKTSRGEAVIYFATVGMIVCTDLLVGVIVGIALSAGKLLLQFSDLEINLDSSSDGKTAELKLDGAATFIALPRLAAALERVPQGAELTVHFDDLTYIDHACLDLISNWAKQHSNFGGALILDWDLLQGRFTPKKKRGQ